MGLGWSSGLSVRSFALGLRDDDNDGERHDDGDDNGDESEGYGMDADNSFEDHGDIWRSTDRVQVYHKVSHEW